MNKDKSNIAAILEEYGEFIPIPTELLTNPRYNKEGSSDRLRHHSIILYGLLLLLSKKQNSKDEEGNVFITITGNDIATLVGTTTSSAPSYMVKQLERFGLIERKEIQYGKPYKLYIKEIIR
jgi:hypothetical protein